MSDYVKFENGKRHKMKDDDVITCEVHKGVKVKFGELDPIRKLAFLEGLDTLEESRCLLLKDKR